MRVRAGDTLHLSLVWPRRLLTLNDLRRLSKTLETEHLTDTLCIIVFVSIMYGSLNDLIIRIIIIVYMQMYISLL